MIIKKMRLSIAVVALAGSVLMTTPVAADVKKETTESQKTESKYEGKAAANVKTALNVRKKGSRSAEIIGKMEKGNLATVVKKGDNWTKIKSGNVTGYVNNQYLVFGDKIETFAEKNVKQVAKVDTETLRVRKSASTNAKVITLVSQDEKLRVKKESKEWAKVQVNGETGYISKDYAKVNYSFGKAKTMEEIQKEEATKQAEQERKAQQAAAPQQATEKSSTAGSVSSNSSGSTSTGTSSKTVSASSVSGSTTAAKVVNYAKQFVGNPYKYGGNSLTGGIDCSGFTQQILGKFGYHISRTSSSQAGEGVAVSTSNLQAGDLLFYGGKSGINHVAMYIGGGQVVHASNSAPYPQGGIKISNAFYRTPVCARRILR